MASRIETMQQRYEEFNQGDIESATQLWADDIVWQGANSTELPGGGEHRGKDEALQVLKQAVGAWDEFRLSADEFFEHGDTVVVLGHTQVRKGDDSRETPVVTSGGLKATRSSVSRPSRTPFRPLKCLVRHRRPVRSMSASVPISK